MRRQDYLPLRPPLPHLEVNMSTNLRFLEKKCTGSQTLACLLASGGGLFYSAAKEPKRTKYVKKAVTQKTVSSLRLL